jgi:hypothetical protein
MPVAYLTDIGGRAMPSYFSYKKSICMLDRTQVISAIKATEMAMRTSKTSYVEAPLFKEQVDEIKQKWPPELTASVRERIKTHKGQVGPEDMRRFVMDAIRGTIPSCKPYDKRSVSAEMALATLFRRAPDYERNFRAYRPGGPVIGYKVTPRPGRMVIDKDRAGQAEIFVYCYYCEDVDLSMILGYATQDDVRKMRSGNMHTLPNECMWTKDAYFQDYQKLRPMTEFLNKFSITTIPSMTLFESPPLVDDLPLEPNRYLKTQLEDSEKTNGSEDEKFMRSILGLDKVEEKPTEKASFDL